MKMLLTGILALTTSAAFAQSLTVDQLASLMTNNKSSLESVNPGMTKKVVATGVFSPEENVTCDYTQTSIQSVLKIEGDKIIVLSQEEFVPGKHLGCAGLERTTQTMIFFEDKPSLAQDLEDLKASNAKSIVKNGDIVSMVVSGTITDENGAETTSDVAIQYNITKSSFRNMVSTEAAGYKAVTTDMADIDVNSVDLKKVLFCPDSEAAAEECMEGDFSDILF